MSHKVLAVILAGGKGTRIGQTLPKVLYRIAGKPMIYHTLDLINRVGIDDVKVVVGFKADEVIASLGSEVDCVYQWQQNGTADAVMTALKETPLDVETIIAINGDDSAFYSPTSIKNFIENHISNQAVASIITIKRDEPGRLGRVVRDEQGDISAIVEAKEADEDQLKIKEVNAGCYCFNVSWLKANIFKITQKNSELYLTDLIEMARQQSKPISSSTIGQDEWLGVNTPEELNIANDAKVKQLSLQKQPNVFLVELDNTLLNTEEFKSDIIEKVVKTIIQFSNTKQTKSQLKDQYTETYETYKKTHPYTNIPDFIHIFTEKIGIPELEESIKTLYFTYDFRKLLFPQSIELLEYLKQLGEVVLYSHGDLVFQPIKIRNSGLIQYINDYFVFEQITKNAGDLMNIYADWQKIIIDDQVINLEAFKTLDNDAACIWLKQGPYQGQSYDKIKPDNTVSDFSQLISTIDNLCR